MRVMGKRQADFWLLFFLAWLPAAFTISSGGINWPIVYRRTATATMFRFRKTEPPFWYGHCLVLCSVVSDRGLPCILSLRIPISFVLFITSIMVWCKKEWLISQPLWYIIYLEVIGIEFPIALSKGKNYKKISILNFRR